MIGSLAAVLACLVGVAASQATDNQFRKVVDCKNKPNGNYVYGCSRFYSTCVHGVEYTAKCYDGLVLNPENNNCDRASDVEACDDPAASRNKLFKSKDPFTCQGKSDGGYVDGCNSQYIRCDAGIQRFTNCATGTVFDPKSQNCDWPANVPACNKPPRRPKQPTQPAQQQSAQQQQPQPPQQQQQQQPQRPQPPQQGGSQPQQPQPPQQQQQSQRPQPPQQGGSQPLSGPAQPPAQPQRNVQPSAPHPSQPLNGPRSLRIGAEYVAPVYPKAPQAAPQRAAQPPAPAPIPQSLPQSAPPAPPAPSAPQYSQQAPAPQAPPAPSAQQYSQQAPAPQALPAPSAPQYPQQAPASQAPQYQPQAPPAPQYQQTPQRAAAPPAPKHDFDCSSKPSGVYAPKGCASTFWKCANGRTFKYDCAPSTFYNSDTEQCDYKENIVSCGGQAPTTSAPIAQQPYGVQSDAPIRPPVDFQCGGKADGYYTKQPCTPKYYTCLGGQAAELNCPSGTVYDPTSEACDYANVCGKPKAPAPVAAAAPPQPPRAPVNFDCSGKVDGFYAKTQCAPQYYSCSGGQATELRCPVGTAYDSIAQTCEYTGECGKPKSQAPVLDAAVADRHGGAGYYFQPSSAPAVQQPYAVQSDAPQRPPVDFQCAGKADGYYAKQPCTPKYYTCLGGQAAELSCPSGTVYDAISESCDYANECGKPKTPAPVTIAPQQQQRAPVNFNCGGQVDGFYAKKQCDSLYYSCSGGQATELRCPVGTAYDSIAQVCEYTSECGKPKTPAPVVQSDAPAQQYQAPAAPAPQYQQPQAPAPQYQQPQAPVALAPQYQQPQAPAAPAPAPQAPQYQQPQVAAQSPPVQPPQAQQYQQPQTPPAEIPAQSPVAAASYPSAAQSQPQPQQSAIQPRPGGNPCQKLSNGIYGRPCSRYYFVCSNQKTYDFICPHNQAYVPQTNSCQPREQVTACSAPKSARR